MRGRLTGTWVFEGLDDGVDAASALPYPYPQRRTKEKQRQENSFVRIHERRMIIQYNIGSTCTILGELARITHERFCYKSRIRCCDEPSAGRLAARSLDVLFKYASGSRGSACPSRNATARFRNEPS